MSDATNSNVVSDAVAGDAAAAAADAPAAKCSPATEQDGLPFTCFSEETLRGLRDRWNARHPDVRIDSDDPRTIHRSLQQHMGKVCGQERCWLRQTKWFGRDIPQDWKDSFVPKAPSTWKKNPNEWLSSIDIARVMRQYEKAYKCFDFIGPSPIDFDKRLSGSGGGGGECVWDELCHFSVRKQWQRGKFKIGMIFNTDPHTKAGEHWISMFVHLRKASIVFFDSTGDPAPPEIRALVKRIQAEGRTMSPPLHFRFETTEGIEHQKQNTECGIYSLFFIINMLKDKITLRQLRERMMSDKYMHSFRKVFFDG